ncbi:MAG: DUF4384 domain-containing protein [Parvularculaceae bacterium]
MDDLLLARQIKDVPITIKGIPDQTGQLQVGRQDMLISAIAKMSRRSNAFAYIDFKSDPYVADLKYGDIVLDSVSQGRGELPRFFIAGSITQLDEGATATSQSGGVRALGVDLGASKSQTSSIITMDMHIGAIQTGRLLNYANSKNSIAFSKSDKGVDGGAELSKNGVFYQFAVSRSEGAGQAARTLIEFTAIESLGKLAGVPYWQCLGMSGDHPEIKREREDLFSRMSRNERNLFGQSALSSQGAYKGPIDGKDSVAFSDALAKFQDSRSLRVSGLMDLPTYLALDSSAGKPPIASSDPTEEAKRDTPRETELAAKSGVKSDLPPLSLKLTPAFSAQRVGDKIAVKAILNDDAYLYCYYRNAVGEIARVFPNRSQPSPYVPGGAMISVPDESAWFELYADHPNSQEAVACFASRNEFGPRLPEALKTDDVVPINIGSWDKFLSVVTEAAGQGTVGAVQGFKIQ